MSLKLPFSLSNKKQDRDAKRAGGVFYNYSSFFHVGGKKRTVPDIKRCKSAFCSRRGAGHGAEMGPLETRDTLSRLQFSLCEWKKDIISITARVNGRTVNSHPHTHTHAPHTRTHAHALSDISTACKQWAHMTAGLHTPRPAHTRFKRVTIWTRARLGSARLGSARQQHYSVYFKNNTGSLWAHITSLSTAKSFYSHQQSRSSARL